MTGELTDDYETDRLRMLAIIDQQEADLADLKASGDPIILNAEDAAAHPRLQRLKSRGDEMERLARRCARAAGIEVGDHSPSEED